MVVVKYSQVNEELLNNLVFSKDDRDNIKINYKDGNTKYKDEKLVIQGTTVRVPFGVSRNDNGRLGQTVLSFEARKVKDEEKMNLFNKNVEEFEQAMKLIDNKFRKEFNKNYEIWMNDTDLEEDELEDMYKSFIVVSDKYADNMKVEMKDYTFTDKNTNEQVVVQTDFFNWKTHEKMSSDIMLGNGSLKGDYIKPQLIFDTMIIKRGDGGKGETIRPKITIPHCKYFPGEKKISKVIESRFNHVDDDDDY